MVGEPESKRQKIDPSSSSPVSISSSSPPVNINSSPSKPKQKPRPKLKKPKPKKSGSESKNDNEDDGFFVIKKRTETATLAAAVPTTNNNTADTDSSTYNATEPPPQFSQPDALANDIFDKSSTNKVNENYYDDEDDIGINNEHEHEKDKGDNNIDDALNSDGAGEDVQAADIISSPTPQETVADSPAEFANQPPSQVEEVELDNNYDGDWGAIDENAMLDDSDVEIMDSTPLFSQSQSHTNLQSMKDILSQEDNNDSSSSNNNSQKQADDEYEKKIQGYLGMGIDYDTAVDMAKRTKKQTRVFTVTVYIKSANEQLKKFDTQLDVQSDIKFSELKNNYLEHLKQQKCSKKIFDHAQSTSFIFKTVKLDQATRLSVVNVKECNPEVSLELMTDQELYEYLKKRKEAEEQRLLQEENTNSEDVSQNDGEIDYENMPNEHEKAAKTPSKDESSFRIKMRGADGVEHLCMVRPQTAISSLVEFYRKKASIDANKPIKLEFDDEPLNQDETVGDTELEDDFTIDVYL